MGWCAEFACNINSSCESRMVAGHRSCSCEECGVVCGGRYPGCTEVWAAGPRRNRGTRPPMPGKARGRGLRPATAETAPPPPPAIAADAKALDEMRVMVEDLRFEMRALLTMLSQQQAVLAMLVNDRQAAPPARATRPMSPIEWAVESLLPSPKSKEPVPAESQEPPPPPTAD